jgi:asparagine synthase (glutamine-hydrolysing)
LRSAARSAIPREIRERDDKRPFPVPHRQWILGVLKDFSRDVLLSPQSLDRGIIDPDRLRRWDLSATDIWDALNLELWFRVFIDRDPAFTGQSIDRTVVTTGAR